MKTFYALFQSSPETILALQQNVSRDDIGAAQKCTSHHAIENTIKLEIKRDHYLQRKNRIEDVLVQRIKRLIYNFVQCKNGLFLPEASLFLDLDIENNYKHE